jgi:photosystem II stability/assembly factor-like uncharacterized protein
MDRMFRVLALAVTTLISAGEAVAADGTFHVRGLGGAGGMFVPSVSPYDPNLMFVACDMSGTYRSQDGGKSWEMFHYQQMNGNSGSAFPAYFPKRIFWNRAADLRVSEDQGRTWKSCATNFPWGNAAIAFLTAVPGTPDVLFVSTANGLWRSEDDGKSFAQVLTAPAKAVVALGAKLCTFSGPNTFQASMDSGKTWTAMPVASFGNNSIFGFTGGADASGSALFASVWNLGIARSRDEGKTWQVVYPKYEDQRILQMAAGQTKTVYAAQNGGGWCKAAWASADGGDTWTNCFRMTGPDKNVEASWVQTQLHWGYVIMANGFAVNRADPKTAFLTTQGDFYITRNGGTSWQQCMNEILGVLPGDPGIRYRCTGLEVTSCWGYYFDPFDKAREYIAYTDIGFGRTVDNGKTWIWSGQGSPWINTFYNIAFDPEVPGRLYAACSSRHDIPHWTHVSPNEPKNPSHVGGVCVSTNGAVTWKSLGAGLPKKPCTDICLDPTSPKEARTLYATFFGEGVFKSVDGGQTWEPKSEGLGHDGNRHAYRIRRHPKSGNLYCLITGCREGARNFRIPGGVWKSTDAGATWSDITDTAKLFWPTTLVVDPNDENRIFVTAATAPDHPQGGVYRTRDGGKTWAHVLKDADVARSGGSTFDHFMSVAIFPDDPQLVYAGTSLHGLWYSRDGGERWSHYGAFPFANVQSINFHPDDHKKLYATTFGAGVWVGPHLPPGEERSATPGDVP